jgi:hypothetical protein
MRSYPRVASLNGGLTAGLIACLLLASGTASSLASDLAVEADVELTGFAQVIAESPGTIAPSGRASSSTGSGRVTLVPMLGDSLSAFIAAEGWTGEGFDQTNELVTMEPVNADIALESTRALTEAYVSVTLGDSYLLTVSAGKVDVSRLFDLSEVAGNQRTQFMNPRFRNAPAISYPGGAENAPRSVGAWVEFENAGEWLEVTVGWTKMGEDSDEPYFFGEARVRRGLHLLVGAYGWQANGLLPDWGAGPPGSRMGFGVFADYEPQISGDLKAFGRLSVVDQATSFYKATWSLGASIGGGPWGRPNDTVAAAFGVNALSDDYVAATAKNANEAVFEVYYRLMLFIADRGSHRPSVEITPNLQILINPNGISAAETAAIAGLRVRSVIEF